MDFRRTSDERPSARRASDVRRTSVGSMSDGCPIDRRPTDDLAGGLQDRITENGVRRASHGSDFRRTSNKRLTNVRQMSNERPTNVCRTIVVVVVVVVVRHRRRHCSFRRSYVKKNATEQEAVNVGKCRFFGYFGTLYALGSWEIEKAFN